MLATFASALKNFLFYSAYKLPKGCRVGIMTFDNGLQFYNLKVIVIINADCVSLIWKNFK
jgi:hypothetical protein